VAMRSLDTWTYQTGMDVGLRRSLDVTASYLFQQSEETQTGDLRDRQRLAASVTWRATRTIHLRGSASRNHDDGRVSTLQEYNGTWNLRQNVAVSAFTTILESTSGAIARRTSVLYDHRLTARTAFSVAWTESRSNVDSDTDTRTLQAGVRANF
jgi:hypothetical protein